ncbi:MAG TPA: hypothetical protein VH637_12165 [Streptosporangiaceae bacterium]|jgi:LmbE family N-acetylglucosaminyl deacetylase
MISPDFASPSQPWNGAVMVSPHLDDAVLSATSRLASGGFTVGTVYAAIPDRSARLGAWDRLTCARNSNERMHERIAEDDRALAMLDARPHRLSFLDSQYSPPRDQPEAIERELALRLAGASEVWLPAGIAGNTDHLRVRRAALRALRSCDTPVFLYADLPYSVLYGWPTQVCGRDEGAFLDTTWWFEQELRRRRLRSPALELNVVWLDDATRRRKRAAMAAYRSQLPALSLSTDESLDQLTEIEVYWALTRPAREFPQLLR